MEDFILTVSLLVETFVNYQDLDMDTRGTAGKTRFKGCARE